MLLYKEPLLSIILLVFKGERFRFSIWPVDNAAIITHG